MRLATSGYVRVPEFQRPLRWDSQDVLNLFDSLYRGYPIGSLLLLKRRAPADRLRLGPLAINAPEVPEAWWVVDGQQRLTALAASMARPDPVPRTPDDPFVVFFDPLARAFQAPAKDGTLPDHWVSVTLLLDATRLSEWIFTWSHARDDALRGAVFEASRRLREYHVPLYVLASDEPDALREIFFRVNKSGKPLKWEDVHDALYGHDGSRPSTVRQLAEELSSLGMGRFEPRELTACLLALRGLDATRTLADHRRKDPHVLRGAVAQALPVLRSVLHLLRTHAEVPHVRLLPRTLVVEVLARFFALHPHPQPRSLELLTRWTWRVFLRDGMYEERTLKRRAVDTIKENEEEDSLQHLLALVPRARITPTWPTTFDARAARARVVLLALASLGPRDLDSGQRIDVAALVEERKADACRPIFAASRRGSAARRDPANRILLPGSGSARSAVMRCINSGGPVSLWEQPVPLSEILASHAISPEAAARLQAGAVDEFVDLRRAFLQQTLAQLGERLAGWSRHDRDRPSIPYLLRDEASGA